MKSLFVFILLASLIPSASLQSSVAYDDTFKVLNRLLPHLPAFVNNLTKVSEDATNGLPIDQSTLNGINEGIKELAGRLGDYMDGGFHTIPSAERNWLSSQITNIREKAATLPINPIDTLQNQGVNVNEVFDNTIDLVDSLPIGP